MTFLRVVSDCFPLFASPDRDSTKRAPLEVTEAAIDEAKAAHRSVAAIETEIPHCCFYCSWCGSPILLPHDSLGLPFGGPLIRRIEARSIGTVCGNCSHVGGYSLFHGCHGYNTRHRFVQARPTGKTVLLDWLRCDERTCVFPLPFFTTLEDDAAEGKIKEFAAQWIWDDLKCTSDHDVHVPRWLLEAGLHRVPIDLTKVGAQQPR
jgi:hypothetical protein